MANDLVKPADLASFPGAPFDDAVVDAAVADLRNALGWHVAPVRTETITLDHDGGRDLILPSRKVIDVTAVRDMTGTTPTAITGYRISAAGYLVGYWPCGPSAVEVDLDHGYTGTPDDVIAAVASLCAQLRSDSTVRAVQIDDFQQTLNNDVAEFGSVSRVMVSYGLPRDF